MKLAIGTAPFGIDPNADNAVSAVEVKEILARAQGVGVQVLHTSPEYGESEAIIGRATDGFRVVTKIPPLDHARGNIRGQIRDGLESSLQRLRRMFVYGLIVQDPADLTGPNGDEVAETMEELRSENKIEMIGLTINNENDLAEAFGKGDFDLVSVPLNLFDQRLLRSGVLAKLKAAGVEIHARSPYLGGLLLTSPENLDKSFSSVKKHLAYVNAVVEEKGMTILDAALGFVAGRPEVDQVVVDITSAEEFTQTAIAMTLAEKKAGSEWAFTNDFVWTDEQILNYPH